jgi:hypothetical protein
MNICSNRYDVTSESIAYLLTLIPSAPDVRRRCRRRAQISAGGVALNSSGVTVSPTASSDTLTALSGSGRDGGGGRTSGGAAASAGHAAAAACAAMLHTRGSLLCDTPTSQRTPTYSMSIDAGDSRWSGG